MQEPVRGPEICREEDIEVEEELGDGEEAEEAGEEGDDDGEQSLTEDEEAIVAYLRDDEPMPPELLQKLLKEWWHEEPFRSAAFSKPLFS